MRYRKLRWQILKVVGITENEIRRFRDLRLASKSQSAAIRDQLHGSRIDERPIVKLPTPFQGCGVAIGVERFVVSTDQFLLQGSSDVWIGAVIQ
jgi:hypothetical protein